MDGDLDFLGGNLALSRLVVTSCDGWKVLLLKIKICSQSFWSGRT